MITLMLQYREEIDGLRGIAVLAVILYHADFNRFFSGGYVGVDIFFVISGYLITAIILEDISENEFSLKNFYERRCRRILPMLFFCMWISVAISLFCVPPTGLEQIGHSIYAIVTLRGNFFFWRTDDYFNPVLAINPLVHTWSLAVEEQFYLVYPILVYGLQKRPRVLFHVSLMTGVLSFVLAQWGDNLEALRTGKWYMFAQHRWANYFLPFGRIWELLIGCGASVLMRRGYHERVSKWIQNVFGCVGLVLIVLSVYMLNSRHTYPFPNGYTLMPTMGTFFILVCGVSETVVGKILSFRVLRWLGLISYSLYLWHQPTFTLIAQLYPDPLTSYAIGIVILCLILLSTVTYHLIELPFRNKNHLRTKQIFKLSLLATIFSIMLSMLIVQVANKRIGIPNYVLDAQLQKKIERMYGHSICYGIWDQRKECQTFSNSSLKKLLVVGDSYGDDTMHMIQQGGHLNDYEIRGFYIPNKCQIYSGEKNRLDFIPKQFHQECRRSSDILDALPLIQRSNVIIFASHWFPWCIENLPNTLKRLNMTNNQHYLIVSGKYLYPCNEKSDVKQFWKHRFLSKIIFEPKVAQGNAILRNIFGPAKFIDLEKLICNGRNQSCNIFTPSGALMFRDCFHLSRAGARHLGDSIFKENRFNL